MTLVVLAISVLLQLITVIIVLSSGNYFLPSFTVQLFCAIIDISVSLYAVYLDYWRQSTGK